MNGFIWLIIGLVIIAAFGLAFYRWYTGGLPSQIDRDGDGRLF